MTTLLLILHFLAFSVGIGGSLSNLLAGAVAARSDPAVRPAIGAVARRVGMMATGGLVLLWLTGIALVQTAWEGWASMPPLFWAKIALVVVLTVCSALMNATVIRADRDGTPPPPERMRMLGTIGALSAILALILAIAAFSG